MKMISKDKKVTAYVDANDRAEITRRKALGYTVVDESVAYQALTVDELKDEIAKRNEGRAEDEQIKPAGAKKADLQAALEGDDEKAED